MERKNCKQSIEALKENLKRLESVIGSKHVRPADYMTRDRMARKLRDAEKLRA